MRNQDSLQALHSFVLFLAQRINEAQVSIIIGLWEAKFYTAGWRFLDPTFVHSRVCFNFYTEYCALFAPNDLHALGKSKE